MLGRKLQARKLGHPLDQLGHLFAEQLGYIGPRGAGVLDHVMQKGGDNGRRVQPVFGQDARHLDRVREIGIARGPQLRPMHAHGVDIGAVQQGFVRRRVVGLDPVDQLELA